MSHTILSVIPRLDLSSFTLISKQSSIRQYRNKLDQSYCTALVIDQPPSSDIVQNIFAFHKAIPRSTPFVSKIFGYSPESTEGEDEKTVLVFEQFDIILPEYIKRNSLNLEQAKSFIAFMIKIRKDFMDQKIRIAKKFSLDDIVVLTGSKIPTFRFWNASSGNDFEKRGRDEKDDKTYYETMFNYCGLLVLEICNIEISELKSFFQKRESEEIKENPKPLLDSALEKLQTYLGLEDNAPIMRVMKMMLSYNETIEAYKPIQELKPVVIVTKSKNNIESQVLDNNEKSKNNSGDMDLDLPDESTAPRKDSSTNFEPPTKKKIDGNKYDLVDGSGYFKEYVERLTGRKFFGFETTIFAKELPEKTPFEFKVEAYLEVQDKVNSLLKIKGYYIKSKSKSPKSGDWVIEYVVLLGVEQKVQTLKEYLKTKDLNEKDLLDMASRISGVLNVLCLRTNFKVSYITLEDIVVVTKGMLKEFKFFGIQNSGGIGSVPSSMFHWVSPEMFVNMKLRARKELDFSKSLNYSFGILLLQAFFKEEVPTAHRSRIGEREVSIKNLEDEENPVIQEKLKRILEKYASAPLAAGDRLRAESFFKLLEKSLKYDEKEREGLEIWLKLDELSQIQSLVKQKSGEKKRANPEANLAQKKPVIQINSVKPKAELPNNQQNKGPLIQEKNFIIPNKVQKPNLDQTTLRQPQSAIFSSNVPKPVVLEVTGENKANSNQRMVISNPKPNTKSNWICCCSDFQPEEMEGYSAIVGGFFGLIFMGIIISILLVTG